MEQDDKKEHALANLQRLKSEFRRKINELKALRYSALDALTVSQVTEEDCEVLKTELQNLASLRQEFEASGKEFNVKFGWKHAQEVAEVNKSLEASLNAFFDIKVNVEILIRKVSRQLAKDDRVEWFLRDWQYRDLCRSCNLCL